MGKGNSDDKANNSNFGKSSLISGNWVNFLHSQNQNAKFKVNSTNVKVSRKRILKPAKLSKVVALDCEMVSDLNGMDMLARVAVVDFNLTCIYDKFVKPTAPIGDFRTRFSGIRAENLEQAEDFATVKEEVRQLLYNKFLVGHAVRHDLQVLQFGHHAKLIRDSSLYAPFREVSSGKTPSLKKLASHFLNESIQEGEHSPIQDAEAAMKLYKKFRHDWEKSLLCTSSKTPI